MDELYNTGYIPEQWVNFITPPRYIPESHKANFRTIDELHNIGYIP